MKLIGQRLSGAPNARKGASLLEYGLLAGLISTVSISVVLGLGEEVESTFSATGGEMTNARQIVENAGNGAGGPGGGAQGPGGGADGPAPDPMILEFTTAQATIYPAAGGDITVDWGDPTANSSCGQSFTAGGAITCAYPAAGTYQVSISGDLTGYGSNTGDATNGDITRVVQWGTTGLESLAHAFRGASNLTDVPADFPATVTSIRDIFREATALNDPDISNWSTSAVTELQSAFYGASSFNQDLNWDVSGITNFQQVFRGASAFDGDLSTWNTASATNMKQMFTGAINFTGKGLDGWNVSSVQDFAATFSGAKAMNADLSQWNTGAAVSMSSMFNGADIFNADISQWQVGQVSQFHMMFKKASAFNADLSQWDVTGVTDGTKMASMFESATAFNADLSGWCVTNVGVEPELFDDNSALASNPAFHPQWGSCPTP